MGSGRDQTIAVLACSLLGCAAIGVFGAPDWTEHTDILIRGGGARDATTALMSSLRRRGAGVTLIAAAASIRIEDRVPGGLFGPADRGAGRALAAQAIDEMQAAAALVAAGPVPAAPAFPVASITDRRAGLETEFADADRDATSLSGSLTDVARDLAAAQRLDTAETEAAKLPVRGLIAQLQARRADLSARYTAQFPAIAITDAEIDQLHGLLSAPVDRAPPSAALATLRAEQARLHDALLAAEARRDTADRRLRETDVALNARLAAPAPAVRAAAPEVSYAVLDSGTTTRPDPRPGACGAVGVAGVLAAWLTRGRLRVGQRVSRLDAIERQVRLPVLRCLDVHGVALALDRPALPAAAVRIRSVAVQLSAT